MLARSQQCSLTGADEIRAAVARRCCGGGGCRTKAGPTSAEAMEFQKNRLEFVELDNNKDNCLDHLEVGVFIKRHPELWAMLGVNLDLSDEFSM